MMAIETLLRSTMGTMWCLCDPTPSGSISTWEDLTTRFFAQFFPPRRTAKLQNDILMFQQHQVQIFYDPIDHTLKRTMDYATKGRLRKMSEERAYATIEELAQYEDEPIFLDRESLNYKNLNIKQLLRVMDSHVDTLMKDVILIMGRSENVFEISRNTIRQLPLKPSRQETFKDLVMNFILDQEEKVRQLKEYMWFIRSNFMQVSLGVVEKLKKK
nr:hypothetical protein [Tanacetum cinerariifolium]